MSTFRALVFLLTASAACGGMVDDHVSPAPDASPPPPLVEVGAADGSACQATATTFFAARYASTAAASVEPGATLDVSFELKGFSDPANAFVPHGYVADGWSVSFANADGSTPVALQLGPNTEQRSFLARLVVPADASAGASTFLTVVLDECNHARTYVVLSRKFVVGAAPPRGDALSLEIHVCTTSASTFDGTWHVPAGKNQNFDFGVSNVSGAAETFDVDSTLTDPNGDWKVVAGPFAPTGQSLTPGGSNDFLFHLIPGAPGSQAVFGLRLVDPVTNATLADGYVPLVVDAP